VLHATHARRDAARWRRAVCLPPAVALVLTTSAIGRRDAVTMAGNNK
jgi:hypothetical protein